MCIAINLLSGRCEWVHYYLLMIPLAILSIKGIISEEWPKACFSVPSMLRVLMALAGFALIIRKVPLHSYYKDAYYGTVLLFLHNIWIFNTMSPSAFMRGSFDLMRHGQAMAEDS